MYAAKNCHTDHGNRHQRDDLNKTRSQIYLLSTTYLQLNNLGTTIAKSILASAKNDKNLSFTALLLLARDVIKEPVLDFSTTIYDSTSQDNFYGGHHPQPVVHDNNTYRLMSSLLSTIELDKLGAIFFRHLRQALPIAGLDLSAISSGEVHGRVSAQHEKVISLDVKDDDSHNLSVHYIAKRALSHAQRDLLESLHSLFCAPLKNALRYNRMRQMATKDMLTGLSNRNGFNEAFIKLHGRAKRRGHGFGLLVIDLDNFKQVNDNYGHQEGDKVLLTVANYIKEALRIEDEAFRFGGDEFCCLIDCADETALSHIASRLQEQMQRSEYLTKVEVSCSIGGAIHQHGESIDALFARADAALYKVKLAGKNAYLAA